MTTNNCSFTCTIPRGEHCPVWDMDWTENCCAGCQWYQPVDDYEQTTNGEINEYDIEY